MEEVIRKIKEEIEGKKQLVTTDDFYRIGYEHGLQRAIEIITMSTEEAIDVDYKEQSNV